MNAMKFVVGCIVSVVAVAAVQADETKSEYAGKSLAELVREDLKNPVRPGGVDGQPFWNGNAVWFMYPPSFDFPVTKGAKHYHFRVFGPDGKMQGFWADEPTASLAPVWDKISAGKVDVWCEACPEWQPGGNLARSFRSFYKMAAFQPDGYKPAPRSYAEAVSLGYGYLLDLPSLKKFAETGKPDPEYKLNCYPSKIHAAVIRAMVRCAKDDPARRAAALKLANAAGDYLLSIAQPEGTPLAGFTPTYEGENYTAKRYAGQNMLDYPCGVGSSFLRLYELTGEEKYLKGAERIAATYLRLQGEDGTWYLKLWEKDGKPVNPNRLHPLGVISFLDQMYAVTKRAEYRAAADRAFGFIEKGPLTDWNWEGQFEDVEPTAKYVNLTKHPACTTAIRLVTRWPDDAKRVAQAREILRYAEDQFVCWRRPRQSVSMDQFVSDAVPAAFGDGRYEEWIAEPGVVEQYHYRENIDASLAKMIRTYLALYRVTGNPLDLAKARALGDSLVCAQQPDGRIPTVLTVGSLKGEYDDWINCMIASYEALEELAALAAVGANDRAQILWTRAICKEKDCYIGWPTVCRRANGELIAAFSGDREFHICPFGKVQLVRSTDDGETWSAPETIRNTCIDDRDAGIIETPDGALVVFTFTSIAFHDCFKYGPYERIWEKLDPTEMREAAGYWSLRSADNGKTWDKPVRMYGSAPHGGIQLKDGRLLMVGRRHNVEGNLLPGGDENFRKELTVEVSSDGGCSWRTIATLAPEKPYSIDQMHEPHVVELDNGTLVTHIRYHGEKGKAFGTLQSESKDGGKTWSEIHETGIPGYPAHLLKLRDGRLLCSYARRDGDNCGEYAVLSSDGGKTWDNAHTIAVCRFAYGDLGYPSTVELMDGTLLTVYYQPEQTGEKPCLMATKWRLK